MTPSRSGRPYGSLPRCLLILLGAVLLGVVSCGDSTTSLEEPTAPGGNPLAALPFYIDPDSNARRQAEEWRASRPADAALMDRIASGSQADWFGDWTPDVRAAVDARTTASAAAGALPVFVAYNIPMRDCGGGAASAADYRAWIRAFAAGIGDRSAAVILEPDALALTDCLSSAQKDERLALLRDAVAVLKARPGVVVYIDAGHAAWLPVSTAASRLRAAGVDAADGFALNTANFQTTTASIAYGEAVSGEIGGGKGFVIDTSRNGNGPADDGEWCNPPGRALGAAPTAATGHPLVHAFLWIKRPGESDGPCNGGPEAGEWWADYALALAANAS